ncbi:MAG: tetratricopeptide repeat protein [Desulfobacterales bacterium]|nr:tetratricopeptide repeat protein [Desulfobacterales bacterium]
MKTRVVLNDAYKRFTLDQDKVLPPEETVKQFKKKLNQIDLDILKDTVRIDNGRLNIPVFISYYGQDAKNVTGGKKQMGKGATPGQAEASAVMELAERFSLFSFKNNPHNFIVEKYRNIKDKAIDFHMIAQSVHDENKDQNLMEKIFEDLPLKWTWATNLTQNKEILIPFDWFFNINEFNGSCAGNCVEEAICQGICEIVERHTSSLISHKRIKHAAINPNSATDPLVLEMLDKYKNTGIKLYITDFTLEMGIPSVGILAYDPSTFPEKSEIVWTAGTTPNPQKALSRALTEIAQLGGDFNTGSCYVASGLPKFTSIEDAGFIMNSDKIVDINTLPDISDDNIKLEVQNCISALAEKRMDVIVLDTMHPLLKIPTFYIIIPGAHFRERSKGADVGMFVTKLLTENNDPKHAINELNQIKKLIPEKYYINFYLGQCFLSLGEPQTALDHFSASFNQNPEKQDIVSIYSYMGICFKDMGKYQKALRVLKEGESLDKERTDIYNLMGFCYFKLKEYEKAIGCFKKVLKLDPSSAIDYANIASNYRDMGQNEKAIEYYLKALGLDPTIEFARKGLEKLQ